VAEASVTVAIASKKTVIVRPTVDSETWKLAAMPVAAGPTLPPP
jgi:hypothetical protein